MGPVRITAHNANTCDCDGDQDCIAPADVNYPDFGAMLGAGWWFECAECGMRTNEDEPQDADGNDLPDLDPVCTVDTGNELDGVYCSPACHDAAMVRMARRIGAVTP